MPVKIGVVIGTSPEIIKMSPIIRECNRLRLDYFILHTGQHYSYNLNKVFFEQQRFANKINRFALILNPKHRVISPKE
jgi:UDP-N-acetylglucosamine 2-epimerase